MHVYFDESNQNLCDAGRRVVKAWHEGSHHEKNVNGNVCEQSEVGGGGVTQWSNDPAGL